MTNPGGRLPAGPESGVLEVANLHVRFGDVRVLRGVSLHVGAGEVVGLVGVNGAGKTTTLSAISGIVQRSGGEIRLDGSPLPASSWKVCRRGVSHVPEGRALVGAFTVRENLKFAAIASGLRYREEWLDEFGDSFAGVKKLLDRRASDLSGGEAQLVAIARGLITNAKVLLVDELSLGLSPRWATAVTDALLTATRTRMSSLLLVDQNISVVSEVCDRVYVMSGGRAEEIVGDVTDVERRVREIYLGHM